MVLPVQVPLEMCPLLQVFGANAANLDPTMRPINGTGRTRWKLRSTSLAVLAGTVALILPAAAEASVTVAGYPVSTSLVYVPSGGNTAVEPAIEPAPDGSDAEWVTVSGDRQNVISFTPIGAEKRVVGGLAADSGIPDNYASVDADGYDWILDNDQGQPENVLYAVGAAGSVSPGLNPVATFDGYGEDMTLGPDGALYISDNTGGIVRCQITATPSAVCSSTQIGYTFDGGAYALATVGSSLWFTDAGGQLGTYSYPGTFSNPFSDTNDVDPGTIVAAPNGSVYVAAGATAGGLNTEIVAYDASGDYEGAIPNLGNVVSMTIGPDGNLWFLDAAGSGSVDVLNLNTGALTQYALPTGMYLTTTGPWKIAPGPSTPSASGTGALFFTGSTADDGTGNAEVGVVTGVPIPVTPGSLGVSAAARVSKRRVAALRLSCVGASNSQCVGRFTVSISTRLKVRVRVRAAKQGAGERYRTVTQLRRMPLGTVNYSVRGGRSQRATVTLSRAAYSLLEKVVGHSWHAMVTSGATLGTVSDTAIKMTGPTPPRPKVGGRPKQGTTKATKPKRK